MRRRKAVEDKIKKERGEIRRRITSQIRANENNKNETNK